LLEWVEAMALGHKLGSASDGGEPRPAPGAEGELTTHSGFSVHARSAQPSDEALLAEFFTHLPEDDLRFRFLSATDKVGDTQLALLTQVDHRLRAMESHDNRSAVRLERAMGFTSRAYPGDVNLTIPEKSLVGIEAAPFARSAA
jgi:hypothetical protein